MLSRCAVVMRGGRNPFESENTSNSAEGCAVLRLSPMATCADAGRAMKMEQSSSASVVTLSVVEVWLLQRVSQRHPSINSG